MDNGTKLADINEKKDLLHTIAALEHEISNKTGKSIAMVAFDGANYAELDDDQAILDSIANTEEELSKITGKKVVLVAFENN